MAVSLVCDVRCMDLTCPGRRMGLQAPASLRPAGRPASPFTLSPLPYPPPRAEN